MNAEYKRLIVDAYAYRLLKTLKLWRPGNSNRWSLSLAILPFFRSIAALRFKYTKKLEMYSSGIVVTTRCTLRCKDCVSKIPYRKEKPQDYPIKQIISDCDKLFNAVDYIYHFGLVGGEFFMHKNVPEILEYLGRIKKIERLTITTNGTIIPDVNIRRLLKKYNIKVTISGYNENVSRNALKLFRLLKKEHIDCVYIRTQEWFDMNEYEDRNRTEKELKRLYRLCNGKFCHVLDGGKIFICGREANSGYYMNYIPQCDSETIDIQNLSIRKIRKKLRYLADRDYANACKYCDGFNKKTAKVIDVAVQLDK